jgi:hypothetical protein
MGKERSISLEKIAVELRTTLQGILREEVKTLKDRAALALAIKRSRSHVESMLYEGKGGLDSWVKAFAYCFKLTPAAIKNLKLDALGGGDLDEADKVWFQLKDKLNASMSDRYYYARIAHAAYQIKQEIISVPARKSRKKTL